MVSETLTLIDNINNQIAQLTTSLGELTSTASVEITQLTATAGGGASTTPFLSLLTAFVLACFIGYFVVWSVTPALHSPLMGVTNAISSVIIVGALIAAGPADMSMAKIFGGIAVILASVNIFGGFIVTQRMLSMFKKKK